MISSSDGFLPHFRAVLIQAREDAGAHQTDIARAAGITPGSVSKFECGHTGWPKKLDRYVDGYATVAGCHPARLWRDALEAWAAAGSVRS